jgi:hypothetical protein
MKKIVLLVALTAILGLLMVCFLAYAEFYKWVDDKGTVHFTDDYSKVPTSYRDRVEVERGEVEIRKNIQEEKVPLPTQKITPGSKEEIRKDIYGQDEAWWKEKVRPWKEKLKEATTNYEIAQKKFMEKSEELSRKRYGSPTQYKFNIIELDRLREERAKYEAQIAEANEMLRKLSKEAEEVKANPVWLK